MSYFNKLKHLMGWSPEAESLDGTEKLLVLTDPAGAGVMKSATAQQIADLGGGGGGYLEYVAFVQWSGNAEPPATVHEHFNTLGGTPVWSRDQAGVYALTLAGAFPYAKTYIQCPRVFWSSDLAAFYSLNALTNQVDDDAVNFLFYDTEDNSIEAGAHIMLEIRVYP